MDVMNAPPIVYGLSGKKIWVPGAAGLVGRSVIDRLRSEGCEIVTTTRSTLDLRRQAEVEQWVDATRPHAVFLVAATVGGIMANSTRPGEFIYDNLVIETNVIEVARKFSVEKLLMVSSSCVYPRLAPQPMTEGVLLTGPLEPTNEMYAIAKIAGMMMCRAYRTQYGCDFISATPANIYGPNDHFDEVSGHVVSALIMKADKAKEMGADKLTIWGTGSPRRELLYVDDAADALVFLMKHYSGKEHVNVGVGRDISIRDLAGLIVSVVGYKGRLEFDPSYPDGMPQKLLDSGRLFGMGWIPKIPLEKGLFETYSAYVDRKEK